MDLDKITDEALARLTDGDGKLRPNARTTLFCALRDAQNAGRLEELERQYNQAGKNLEEMRNVLVGQRGV